MSCWRRANGSSGASGGICTTACASNPTDGHGVDGGHLLAQKLTDKALEEAADAARLVELLEETIEMTRNLSHELNPVEMKTGKLTDHFEHLAADTSRRFRVECKV